MIPVSFRKMDKILSIIIPTYNMEALLDQCLTSLILPDYEHRSMLDVFVVIDGATDASSEIAHKYADKYPETFTVIDKENGNYGSCINAALPRVRGKYVRILDADDSYETSNLSAFLDLLQKLNDELILTDFANYDTEGNKTNYSNMSLEPNKSFAFSAIPITTFLPMHAVTYRTDIFHNIKYHQSEGISYTDMEWVFHPMSQVRTVYYWNKEIYRYLFGREGQTSDCAIRQRSQMHQEKGIMAEIGVMESLLQDRKNCNYEYLEHWLLYRLYSIYKDNLVDLSGDFNLSLFDKKLKDLSKEWYHKASQCELPFKHLPLKLPIVRIWRRLGAKNRKHIVLHPYYLLYKLDNKF